MAKLTDSSPFPFVKYQGTEMIDVPAKYLLWLLNNGLKDGNVKDYIIDVKEALEQEVKAANSGQLKPRP